MKTLMFCSTLDHLVKWREMLGIRLKEVFARNQLLVFLIQIITIVIFWSIHTISNHHWTHFTGGINHTLTRLSCCYGFDLPELAHFVLI